MVIEFPRRPYWFDVDKNCVGLLAHVDGEAYSVMISKDFLDDRNSGDPIGRGEEAERRSYYSICDQHRSLIERIAAQMLNQGEARNRSVFIGPDDALPIV
jgi:hypothetical protein